MEVGESAAADDLNGEVAMLLLKLVGAVLIVAVSSASASADVITFNTSDRQFDRGVDNQGWWSATGPNVNTNDNYFAGSTCRDSTCSAIDQTRNFFTFDLASLSGTVVSATLELRRSFNQSPTATYQLFDVSTDARTLNNNTGTSGAIFDDLGTGHNYGVFQVTNGGRDDTLQFTLNGAGRADIQAASGRFFSIGGDVLGGFLFGGSDGRAGSGIQRLVVTTVSPTPEPASITGVLIGITMIVLGRRKSVRSSRT